MTKNWKKLSFKLELLGNSFILKFSACFLLLLFSFESKATNYYVNDNSITGDVFCSAIGNDANPGTLTLPFRTLNKALTVVNSGDSIFVETGIYNDFNLLIPATLTGISIIGNGYQNTIFDHLFAGSSTDYFICIQGSNTSLKSLCIKGYENNGTQFPGHSGQAITINGTTSSITGILIENVMLLGNGQSGGNPAISVLDKSEVTIRGGGSFCNASGSAYTGGVEAYGKNINLVIENYILADNDKIGFDGGGLRIEGDLTTSVIVRNTRISNNVAVNGGGVAMYNGNLVMNDCIIDGNTIGQVSNTIMGGGIFVSCGNLNLNRCIIRNNNENASGTFRGGGIAGRYNGATGNFSTNKSITLTADSCIFSGNFGDNGKDIYAASGFGNPCNFTLTNCIFSSASTNIVSDATSPATNINVTYVGTAPTQLGSNISSSSSTASLFDLSMVNPPDYSGSCPNIVILCSAASPTGSQTQNFCSNQSPTIADLIAIGSSIQWYSSPTGGIPLISSTPLVNGTTYYATQTVGGCESTIRLAVLVTIVNLSTPTITASGPTSLCTGGSVTLTSSSTTDNTWSTGETTQSITVSAAGTYTVTVNSGGCSATSAGTVVTVNPTPATPTISASGPTTLCSGGSATLTSSSTTGNTWSTGETTQSITVSAAGTYNLFYTDQNGCFSALTSQNIIEQVTPTISISNDTICEGQEMGQLLTNASPLGGTYNWSPAISTSSTLFDSPNSSTSYSVTYSLNGCVSSPALGNIIVNPTPVASFTTYPINFTTSPEAITFFNTSVNANFYQWDFGDVSTSTNESPEHIFNNTENGYVVTLTVSNLYGCQDQVQSIIGYEGGSDFYVPNSFTPDGDEFNNIFKPVFTSGFDPFNFHMSIYDRWGELIFESYDSNKGWDGSLGITGISVQDGVYIWVIDYKKPSTDERVKLTGHVSKLK